MQDEMIDIFTEDGVHLGTETKSLVKKKGYWHQTFQCWVLIKEKEKTFVIFQRRHHSKKFNPNKLATSAGGHIMAGETVEEGIRELHEELGLDVSIAELAYLGLFKEVRKTEKEDNRENQHVFLHETKQPLNEFVFQLEELSGLYQMELDDFYSLANENTDTVNCSGIEWDGTVFQQKTIKVSLEDIVGFGTPFLKWSASRIQQTINKNPQPLS